MSQLDKPFTEADREALLDWGSGRLNSVTEVLYSKLFGMYLYTNVIPCFTPNIGLGVRSVEIIYDDGGLRTCRNMFKEELEFMIVIWRLFNE